jgi:hypothetical protein
MRSRSTSSPLARKLQFDWEQGETPWNVIRIKDVWL